MATHSLCSNAARVRLPICKRCGVATMVTWLLVSQIHIVCGDVNAQGIAQDERTEGMSKLSFSADGPEVDGNTSPFCVSHKTRQCFVETMYYCGCMELNMTFSDCEFITYYTEFPYSSLSVFCVT